MRYPLLVLAATLMAGITQAQADQIVAYNMSGTVASASYISVDGSPLPSPVSVGDHITWTMQYDPSTPASSSGVGWNDYSLNGLLINNIVDQTNGYQVTSWMSTISNGVTSAINLSQHPGGLQASSSGFSVYTYLNLHYNGTFPTANLASFQLNTIPLNPKTTDTQFLFSGGNIALTASIDSISAPTYGASEPGSLTLFLLGVASLVISRVRHLCPV